MHTSPHALNQSSWFGCRDHKVQGTFVIPSYTHVATIIRVRIAAQKEQQMPRLSDIYVLR
jgi:hypothetical protein